MPRAAWRSVCVSCRSCSVSSSERPSRSSSSRTWLRQRAPTHRPAAGCSRKLHLKSVFLAGEIGKEIGIFVHGFTKTLYPGACRKVDRLARYRGTTERGVMSAGTLWAVVRSICARLLSRTPSRATETSKCPGMRPVGTGQTPTRGSTLGLHHVAHRCHLPRGTAGSWYSPDCRPGIASGRSRPRTLRPHRACTITRISPRISALSDHGQPYRAISGIVTAALGKTTPKGGTRMALMGHADQRRYGVALRHRRQASASTEVSTVPEFVDLRVHDLVALDEIELYAEVLGAVAASEAR